jgi:dTDP-3-amino-3,4,6-trideoxy-alpha-D-glucose transaminase
VSALAPIPFIDLRPGEDDAAVRAAIDRVLVRGWFVLGPEVDAFEQEFAAASGAAFAVGVGTGTDAIALALRALDIGTGDEVIVPAMTAPFTALGVIIAGATPVFVDVDTDTLTIDPKACAVAVTTRTRAIVPVHLYGQAADMDAIRNVASRHSLAIAPRDRGRSAGWHALGSGSVQLLSHQESWCAWRRRSGDHRQRGRGVARPPAAQRWTA